MRREPISRYILGEASSGDLRFKLGAVCRDFSPESIDKISTHTASLTLTGKSPANKSVAAWFLYWLNFLNLNLVFGVKYVFDVFLVCTPMIHLQMLCLVLYHVCSGINRSRSAVNLALTNDGLLAVFVPTPTAHLNCGDIPPVGRRILSTENGEIGIEWTFSQNCSGCCAFASFKTDKTLWGWSSLKLVAGKYESVFSFVQFFVWKPKCDVSGIRVFGSQQPVNKVTHLWSSVERGSSNYTRWNLLSFILTHLLPSTLP